MHDYMNFKDIRNPSIGEDLTLLHLGFINSGGIYEYAHCFVSGKKSDGTFSERLVYVKNKSILMKGKDFYKVNILNSESQNSFFKNTISVSKLNQDDLEDILLSAFKDKKFKFTGFSE